MERRFVLVAVASVMALAGGAPAAPGPRALAGAAPGAWDVSRSADGHNPTRLCFADLTALAQWEQRRGNCTRVVISDSASKTVIHYTCTDGGFGRSDLTLLTPRTIRVDTQGISRGLPFAYQLHARRAGACPAR